MSLKRIKNNVYFGEFLFATNKSIDKSFLESAIQVVNTKHMLLLLLLLLLFKMQNSSLVTD